MNAGQGCTLRNCFDATAASQAFAQFAGVLTGFAVAAFVLVVQRIDGVDEDEQGRAERRRAVFGLLASVAVLAMATFAYGVAAGVEGPGAKSQSQYLVATATFAMAGVVLLCAVWELLAPLIAPTVEPVARAGVSALIVALSAYVIVTAADVSANPAEVSDILATRMVPLWAAFLVLVLVAVIGTLFEIGRPRFDTSVAMPVFGVSTATLTVSVFATWVATLKSLDRALPVGALYAVVAATLAVGAAGVLSVGHRITPQSNA